MSTRRIEKGDTVIVRKRFEMVFRHAYGEDALKARKVIFIDKVQGKGRLYLDGPRNLLWRMQAKRVA